MESKKTVINLIATITSFVINMAINFFLTPFIVEKLGYEAYGFIGLANNFVNYVTVVTVALNSVAGRFITIKIHQKDYKNANIYFNSVFMANTVMAIVLTIMSFITVINLQKLIHIPGELQTDVKITFALVFANFILNIVMSIFSISTFVTNRLELSSIANIGGNIIRAVLLICLLYFLKVRLFYVSISALVMTLFISICNATYTKKLLSVIKFNIRDFQIKAVKELISLGIWNSVNSLSQILLTGLDLLIANLFINASEMGLLSAAKSIPAIIVSFLGTIGGIFAPKFTILYAKNQMKELIDEIKVSIKVLGVIVTVPLAGFMIFGYDFYRLWFSNLTNSEILKIQVLSVLTLGPTFISAFVFSLYNINVITNKLKVPVLLTLGISIVSTIVVLILLKTTNIGVYAIAGVSSLFLIFRVVFFVPTYAAYSLKVKLTSFYPPIIRGVFSFVIICIFFGVVNKFYNISSWLDLIIIAIIAGSIGYIINIMTVLSSSERKKFKELLLNKAKIKLGKVC